MAVGKIGKKKVLGGLFLEKAPQKIHIRDLKNKIMVNRWVLLRCDALSGGQWGHRFINIDKQ